MEKTISYLNSTMWYRALKVINLLYTLFCCFWGIGGIVFAIGVLVAGGDEFDLSLGVRILITIGSFIIIPPLTWLIAQIPKWIFYYIVLGTFRPRKNGTSDLGIDELYEEAKKLVLEERKVSASFIQRRLKIGYARSAQLLDMMEEEGIVGPADGANPREILKNKSE